MLLPSFVINLQSLCSPNEDFGKPNERLGTSFPSPFQICEYFIWATYLWNGLRKHDPKRSFGLQNLRLGSIKLLQKIIASQKNQHIASHAGAVAPRHPHQVLSHKKIKRICVVAFRCRHWWLRCIAQTHRVKADMPKKVWGGDILGIFHIPTLCSPNEDFGWPNEHLGTSFRSTFQRGEYLIWATLVWKSLWKHVPKCSFGHPKSSFGEHKLQAIHGVFSLRMCSDQPDLTHA